MCDPISIGLLAGAALGGSGVATFTAVGAGLAGAAAGAATGAAVGYGAKKVKKSLEPPKMPAPPPPTQAGLLPQTKSRNPLQQTRGYGSGGAGAATLLTGSRGSQISDTLLGNTTLLGR